MSIANKIIFRLKESSISDKISESMDNADISDTMSSLQSVKDRLDLVISDFIPDEDDSKTHKLINDASNFIGKALLSLKGIK